MIMSDFRDYMRSHGHVFSHVPVDGEVWISQSWGGYHEWEDGRFDLNVSLLSQAHLSLGVTMPGILEP